MSAPRILAVLSVMVVRAACAAAPGSAAAQLGSLLFADPSLSASGRLACASCHDPTNAYAAPRTSGVVMLGGPALDRPGRRTVPSLRYLGDTPRFTRHYNLSTGREQQDRGPAGGFMRDGRVDTLRAQVMLPWFDAAEMANPTVTALATRLRAAGYSARIEQLCGAGTLQSDSALLARATEAIEAFELEDSSFHPYSSRYDQFLAGRTELTEQEVRGLRMFVDPTKGNCAECHPHTTGPGGRGPAFTDFSFHALGVPRNPQLPANADQRSFDLGLCGPRRVDLAHERSYCGYFKTPTLRNVARRQFLFHNGRFSTLAEAVRFYVERDRHPELWFPRGARGPLRYDDLPAALRGNVNHSDAPLNWRPGMPLALSASEIDDVVAFLRTLDDAQ